jgi:hypothetical protein
VSWHPLELIVPLVLFFANHMNVIASQEQFQVSLSIEHYILHKHPIDRHGLMQSFATKKHDHFYMTNKTNQQHQDRSVKNFVIHDHDFMESTSNHRFNESKN